MPSSPSDQTRRRPVKRPRPILNCAECRRLKIKCDKSVPCANCVKRGCAHICPQQTLGSVKSIRSRVLQLEREQLHRDESPLHSPVHSPVPLSSPNRRTSRSDAPGETAGVGTLVVNPDGGSKFIGQSASFQWLRDETNENAETRHGNSSEGFPFHVHPPIDFISLWSQLPPKDEALHLLACFHRHIAWNGSPILEDDLLAILERLYNPHGINSNQQNVAFQPLALVYIVLALGSKLNMEVAADDPKSMEFYRLSQQCLVSGNFLVNNSLTTVQALSLMAKFTAYCGMRDVAWQIRGMASRIMLAMGLHRDGQSWNLSAKELNNRRRTFWETYSTDVLISSNWDRPSGLHPDLFDTQLPDDYNEGMGFERQRCRLAMLAQEALQESLKIRSNYERLREIWHKILEVESATPFRLRNRAALRFMVSKYPTLAEVEANTPPTSNDLRIIFQSHDLIDVASTAILSMFRPYFVHAAQAPDPSTSMYGEAYLAVIERSSMLIANLRSLYATFPLVSARHWFFWNHAFSGAVSLATICIFNPGSPLVDQALNDLNSIISLYNTVQSTVPPKWVKHNLQWLLELKARAQDKINHHRAGRVTEHISPASTSEEMTENLLLAGWRNRLVELGRRDPAPEVDDADAITPTGLGFDISTPDFLSQLLGLTAEGPQFINPLENPGFEFDLL